jgi:TP901 family phage tail tape measure protein
MAASTTLTAEAVIRAIDQFSGPVKQMAGSLDAFNIKSSNFGKETQKFAKNSAIVGAGVTAALAIPLSNAVSQYADFEERMVKVAKVFDGPKSEFNALTDGILRLQAAIPVLNTDLARLAQAAAQSGLKGTAKEVLEFVQLGAEFAKAFDIPAERTGEALARLRVALKLPMNELRDLADSMNYLGNETATAEADLLQFTERAAGHISQLGKQSQNGILALGSSMITMGVEWHSAEMAVRNLVQRLSKGDKAMKPVKAALDELGMSAKEVAKGLVTDFGGTVEKLFAQISKMPRENQAGLLNDLFGDYAGSRLGKIAGNVEEYRRQLALVSDEKARAGSVAKEFSRSIETLNSHIILLNNQLSFLSATFIKEFYPQISAFIKFLTSLVKGFSEQPAWVKWLTFVGTVLIALGPLILAVAVGVYSLVAAFSVLGAAFAAIAALAATPIAAAVGLAAGIMAIYLALRMFVSNVPQAMEQLDAFGSWIGGKLMDGLNAATGWIKRQASAIGEWVSSAATSLYEGGKAMGQSLLDGLGDLGTAIYDKIKSGIDSVWKMLTGFKDQIAGFFSGLFGGGEDSATSPNPNSRSPKPIRAPREMADQIKKAIEPVRNSAPEVAPQSSVRQVPTAELEASIRELTQRIQMRQDLIAKIDANISKFYAARQKPGVDQAFYDKHIPEMAVTIRSLEAGMQSLIAARDAKQRALNDRQIRDIAPGAGQRDLNVDVRGKVTGKVEIEADIKVDGGTVIRKETRGGDVAGELNGGTSMPDTGAR